MALIEVMGWEDVNKLLKRLWKTEYKLRKEVIHRDKSRKEKVVKVLKTKRNRKKKKRKRCKV